VLDHEDPSVADKFSVSRLRRSMHGRNRTVPSAVHGAPLVRRARRHRPLFVKMHDLQLNLQCAYRRQTGLPPLMLSRCHWACLTTCLL
jgi:hypothetical protein